MSFFSTFQRTYKSALVHFLTIACLVTGFAVSACKPSGQISSPSSPEHVEQRIGELEKRLRTHPENWDDWRELSHLYWIYQGNSAKAIPILDRLAQQGDFVAQLSRLVIAESRFDYAEARRQALALVTRFAVEQKNKESAEPSENSHKNRKNAAKQSVNAKVPVVVAEFAAHRLGELHGSLASDDQEFMQWFDKLDPSLLPNIVRQPLLSLRGQIARRLGTPYQSYYEAQGCIKSWAVGPVTGQFGVLELANLGEWSSDFEPDPHAILAELACVVRVWNPTTRLGLRRMQTTLQVPKDELELEFSAGQPMRAYLDGQLIARTDLSEQWPANYQNLRLRVAPGPHRLDIWLTVPGVKSWLLVRATDGEGNAVSTTPGWTANEGISAVSMVVSVDRFADLSSTIFAQPTYAPLNQYMKVHAALLKGNSYQAEQGAEELRKLAPRFAEGHLLRYEVETEDPSRDATISLARQQSALKRALAIDPSLDLARVRLLEIKLNRDEASEVVTELEALPPSALRHIPGEILRFRAYIAKEDEYRAESALAAAAKHQPENCEVLRNQRLLARNHGNVLREEELLQNMHTCVGTLELRAMFAKQKGDDELAERLFREQLERSPDDVEALKALVEIALATKKYEQALHYAQQIVRLDPYAASTQLTIADILIILGKTQEARKTVEQALTRLPHNSALREIGEHVGIHDDIWNLRIDGRVILKNYRSQEKQNYTGVNEVMVLDRSAVRIYADGSSRHIVHTIHELRSKEAIDQYGEITPLEHAKILTLHSIKADGTVVEPEAVAGKESLSLRNLEIGDAVEYEFILDQEASPTMPGYFDITPFRFQSEDVPFHISELVVAHPRTLPIHIEARNQAPQEQSKISGDLQIHHWRVEHSQRLGVEPSMRSLLDEVPFIWVYGGVNTQDWLHTLTMSLFGSQRRNPELNKLTEKLIRKQKNNNDKIAALRTWVLENIEDSGSATDAATVTLARRRGSRLLLLQAMLDEAGIRNELWLARSRFAVEIDPQGNPMLESYNVPMLAVWPEEQTKTPTILMLNSKTIPLGYIPPGSAESQALRISFQKTKSDSSLVRVPATPRHLQDRRDYQLALDIDSQGNGTVQGTIELQGMEALAWREQLRAIDRDRLSEGFERAELARLFQGATVDLEDLQIEQEKQLAKPLRLIFRAKVRGAALTQNGEIMLRSAIVPMNRGLDFTALPTRKTGLVIPYAPIQTAIVKVHVQGAKFHVIPQKQAIETNYGRYIRTIRDGGENRDSITIHTESELQLGVIETEKYPNFTQFTRAIETAENELLRAQTI